MSSVCEKNKDYNKMYDVKKKTKTCLFGSDLNNYDCISFF